jgi:hypothetical protein
MNSNLHLFKIYYFKKISKFLKKKKKDFIKKI